MKNFSAPPRPRASGVGSTGYAAAFCYPARNAAWRKLWRQVC